MHRIGFVCHLDEFIFGISPLKQDAPESPLCHRSCCPPGPCNIDGITYIIGCSCALSVGFSSGCEPRKDTFSTVSYQTLREMGKGPPRWRSASAISRVD